ncbi:unnamed protein product [Darwinula stevensoni]|uniref:Uncharacterized protein n=1 Tax=Darwinula stevensoni TaxID=69355 RepID=A0A7R8XE25_9CRUS|nr:unnamed protein product [Darwinula stevensoni]CAG0889164.1 unnamed protein product [Darwinula stevensoni]
MVTWEPHSYAGELVYKPWAQGVGWFLAAVTVVQIPLWGFAIFIYHLFKGNPRRAFVPTSDWGPGDPEARQKLLAIQGQFQNGSRIYWAYDNPVVMDYNGLTY